MLDRFNFYDIYGYVIPGLILIGLLLLPSAIVKESAPSPDFGTAVASVILAYIIGHLLHRLSQPVFVHTTFAHDLLASNDKSLSLWAKQTAIAHIRTRFGLNLETAAPQDSDKLRREAFHLCRAMAVQEKAARYLEQWQSLYVTMRHVAAAFILGAASCVGWLVKVLDARSPTPMPPSVLIAVAIAAESLILWFVMGFRKPSAGGAIAPGSRAPFYWTCLALTVLGFLQADPFMINTRAIVLLSSAVVGLVLLHRLLIKGYRTHSDSYAREVFMTFITLATAPPPSPKPE